MKKVWQDHRITVYFMLAAILFGLTVSIALNAVADQGLTGNPSSANIQDLRPVAETAFPSVSSQGTGKTWQVWRKVDFSDSTTTAGHYVTIGTIPAYHVTRAVAIEVATAEGDTATCDVYFGTQAAVNNADFNSTGTLASAAVYASRAATAIALKPDHNLDAAVVTVWVLGETLVGRD